MPPIPVDLHTGFTLSCMTDPYPRRRADCDEDEEEERDHAAALAKMQGRVPKRAYSLGVLGHTLADRPGYTWRMEEHLYLVPLRGGDSRWGLLRISWDDNECFDQWLDGAQLSGVSDPKEAALALVLATFDQWSVDLESEYDAGYAAFLDALRKKTLVRVGMEAKARAKPRAKPKRCRRGDSRARMKRMPIILGTPADRGRWPSAISESGGAHCGCRLSGEPVG